MERISVTFKGEGAGVCGLTWGQQQVFDAMREVGSSFPMGGVVALPPGVTVEDSAEYLRFLMSRYPAMRSRLRFAADGSITQEVFAEGEAFLEVYPAESPDAAAALAAEVEAAWRAKVFAYADEWPLRTAVVRIGADVTHIIAVATHSATDGSGLAVMMRELAGRDGELPPPPPGPLEVAAAQGAVRRQTDAAMRYWETQLRAIAPQRFPAGFVERDGDRYRQVVWRSPAMLAAAERLAERTGLDTAAVVLAAYAVAFGRVTGGNPFAAQVIVGNRFRPGLADAVTCLAQNGLVVLDAAGVTAAEAVARARQASMSASKHGYYDAAVHKALLARLAGERGEPIDLHVFYNDRRMIARPSW
jgi:hypothetical protein